MATGTVRGESQDIVSSCIDALASAGAPKEFFNFYADVIQCEYDMLHTLYRMQKELREELDKDPLNCELLFISIQGMMKKFYNWKICVDSLSERESTIPPLMLNPDKLEQTQTMAKALCSFETTEMNLHEGEDIVITDTTRPDKLRVRNSRGEEGYVPALYCLLPSPDDNSTTAIERLQVHLLTSWTDCVQRIKRLLFDNLHNLCKTLPTAWSKTESCLGANAGDRDIVNRRLLRLRDAATLQDNGLDLSKLHKALISLEKELHTFGTPELRDLIFTVSTLDKAVLCYHSMYKQWRSFRKSLKQAPHPIRLVQRLDQMREVTRGKNFKYYEMRMTLDQTEVLEEITYLITTKTGEKIKLVLPGGTGARHKALMTEQLTSSSQEESKSFVIRSVVDPRDNSEISLQEAISAGIIDASRGVYVNLSTGTAIAIPLAMSERLIKVEYVSTKRSAEKKEAVGLITIRTQINNREYVVTDAIDALTAERLDANEARQRGLINEAEDWYIIGTTGERLSITEAIDQGWVFARYEEEGKEPVYEVHTYAVNEVMDQIRKANISFSEAIKRGLIDRETGDYVNSLTGERTDVVDAIQKGILKAKLMEDATEFNINPSNAMIIDRVQKLNRRVLKGVNVMSALRQAAKEGN